MDKWDPADVGETFDNVLVSIAVNQNFLSEKGGPLERIILLYYVKQREAIILPYNFMFQLS